MAGNGEGLDRDHTAKPLAFPATQHTEKSWELALNILAPGQAHAGKMVDKLSLEDLLDVLALADAFKITSLLKHCFSVLERRGSAMGLVTKLELGEKKSACFEKRTGLLKATVQKAHE
ncbi:hypothetical protein WJX72_011879 [[Myrmecia] bisecta]|uniref:Uncharacterized protein n=1 Tax=[Myrmecia] bisecta TaxID=41462 RepID=A0AAW1RAX2_9CHLO